MSDNGQGFDYDYLVIGLGFGGSVSALRLVEKGYRVGVMETGRRFSDKQAEIRRLTEENRRLKMEKEVLKKATVFFAKETR
jgi:choline dehydrogenase-like flavoprotein